MASWRRACRREPCQPPGDKNGGAAQQRAGKVHGEPLLVVPAVARERSWQNLMRAETCIDRCLVRSAHGSTRPPRPNGWCRCRRVVGHACRRCWGRQRGGSHDPPFHNRRGKRARSARGVIRRHRVLAVPSRATRKGGPVAQAISPAGPHGAGRGDSPARDEIVDDGRTFPYRQNRVQRCTRGMETGGACRKRRAFGIPISPTVLCHCSPQNGFWCVPRSARPCERHRSKHVVGSRR